jgi:glucosamine--fructose-6-phosphate aminotransferase (isomerizing)
MTERGMHTHQEILSQPAAWQEVLTTMATLRNFPQATQFDQVLFTGCGSTFYLSQAAADLYTVLTGRQGRALPASELWLNPALAYPGNPHTLLVAISRSGETSETIHACQDFHAARRGTLITLVNYPESPLASLGDVNIAIPSGQEISLCQTRAFSTLYLAASWLVLAWAGKDPQSVLAGLPQACAGLLDHYQPMAKELAGDLSLDRFYFLGSGSRYGLASELSLKMKEMSLSHSEPFHFMEFRHGPKSMVTPSTLVVGLRSEGNRAYEQAVLDDLYALGGRTLVLDETDADVAFQSGVPEPLRNVLYLPIPQLFAYGRSMAKGLDPDLPKNLDAVVKLA